MNNAEYSFTLDLQNIQSQITLEVNSGDTARRLLITLTNGGKSHKLAEGSMAVISAKKSNGKYLFNKCNIVNTETASIIEYNFTKATTDTPGVMQCEILVADPTEKTIITPRFTMIVDNVINGNEVWSEDENNFISTAMADEATRVEQESQRVDNEDERKDNEIARQEAETARAEAFTVRGLSLDNYGRLAKRVGNLELAAEGKIYNTETLEAKGTALQVDNTLPYGILSRVGGNVKTITVGLPYTFEGGVIHSLEKEDGTRVQLYKYTTDGNALIIPKGSRYWVRFPSKIPEGATVTARLDTSVGFSYYTFTVGKTQQDTVVNEHYNGTTKESASKVTFGEGHFAKLTSTSDNFTLWFTKTTTDTELKVLNLRLLIDSEHLEGVTLYHTEEIEIPDSITSLTGYGEEGNYLDLTEGKFCLADGSYVDVREQFPVGRDIISLLPSSIVKFYGQNGEFVSADYTLTYKTKL